MKHKSFPAGKLPPLPKRLTSSVETRVGKVEFHKGLPHPEGNRHALRDPGLPTGNPALPVGHPRDREHGAWRRRGISRSGV